MKRQAWREERRSLDSLDQVPQGPQWMIDRELIHAGAELGRGSFGVVRVAALRTTAVAIKVMFKDAQNDNSELFEREILIMARLHHPNVVQFLGFARLPELTLVIELFPNGSCEDLILKNKPTGRRLGDVICLCDQMGQAVEYIHAHFIIHRDLKPANFLLTASMCVKLGDFGVARMHDSGTGSSPRSPFAVSETRPSRSSSLSMEQTSNVGTVRYAAPEVFSCGGCPARYEVHIRILLVKD